MSTASLPRIGPARIPPNSTDMGGADLWGRIHEAVVQHIGRDWNLHQGPRSKAVWRDVKRRRQRLSTGDLERIAKSIRPEAQRATAAVIEILTAYRRERRRGERRRA